MTCCDRRAWSENEAPCVGTQIIRRPLSVTIIAWLSIGFGAFFLLAYGVAAFVFLSNPASPSGESLSPTVFLGWSLAPAVYWALVFITPLFLVVDGIALIRGHNWARMAAVIWWGFALLSLLYTYGLNGLVVVQAVLCLLVILFLNTRSAVTWFKQPASSHNQPGN